MKRRLSAFVFFERTYICTAAMLHLMSYGTAKFAGPAAAERAIMETGTTPASWRVMLKRAGKATHFGRRLGWLLALTSIWGCGDESVREIPGGYMGYGAFGIAPGTAKIAVGMSQHFDVSAVTGPPPFVVWTSSNPAVATIDTDGVAKALGKGTTTIMATRVGETDGPYATLEVVAAVASIQVTPATTTVPKGMPQTFVATAIRDDGTTDDISWSATWNSSDTGVAKVEAGGSAKGVKGGTATITATYNGKIGSATLIVADPAERFTVDVTCTPGVITAGAVTTCTASTVKSDMSIVDLTSSVTWSTSDATIADVSNTAGTKGFARGLSRGKTKVIASDAVGATGSFELEVASPKLTSVTINPGAVSATIGTRTKFQAQANYADGTFSDVTTVAVWTSSDSTRATVAKGVVNVLESGIVTITAEFSGQKGTATVSVVPSDPLELYITPATLSLAPGKTQAMTATTRNNDGTSWTVTKSADWSSSDPTVASVTRDGVVTAIKVGTAKITAKFLGLGLLTATASLNVIAP